MLNTMTQWFAGAPRRLVQGGLSMFFAGGAALLAGLVAQVVDAQAGVALAQRFPEMPTWFVPEGPAGYTLAASLVCWGVWAMGSGLRLARAANTGR